MAHKQEQKESVSKEDIYKEHESSKKAFESNLIKEPQSNINIYFERERGSGKKSPTEKSER